MRIDIALEKLLQPVAGSEIPQAVQTTCPMNFCFDTVFQEM
jgi:hypothetical protein